MNILEWLKKRGYEYTWYVKLGGKKPDIVAFNENEIIAFEIKRFSAEIPKAVGQCLHYLKEANKAYVILPSREIGLIRKSSLAILKEQGIGLMTVNKTVKVLLEAKYFSYDIKTTLKKLKGRSVYKTKELGRTKERIKRKIIGVLRDHPEGLTILDLAKFTKLHRHTITKYLYQLFGEGKIYQREVGTAKLCYLKEKFVESVKEKEILEKLKKRLEKK